jgi:hypothetical protein
MTSNDKGMLTMKKNPRLNLDTTIDRLVASTPVDDIHTHVYDPAFGGLLLWGIDELLVYHYLVSEAFRHWKLSYDQFWRLPKTRQAELIWDELFIRHSPISESCRGVLTVLNRLGLDVKKRDLAALRKWFATQTVEKYVTKVMELARVRTVYMTNSPFDETEYRVWEHGFKRDPRFVAALRIDPLLLDWPNIFTRLEGWGYDVTLDFNDKTIREVRRFLIDWTKRIHAAYLMVSLPPSFAFPSDNPCGKLIEKAVLPHCEEHGLPLALMGGVKKLLNPHLKLAGDGVGRSDTSAYENLLVRFPKNKFLVTLLSRENQHELCILARKFGNLHIFGCWWFTNIPMLIDEITRLRIELLGLSVTPQHSDARVFDQIIYKWDHSRRIIAQVLKEKYREIAQAGWKTTPAEIERDITDLFGGAFQAFLRK